MAKKPAKSATPRLAVNPKAPSLTVKQPAPPLVESDDTPEIFATDVVGAGVIGGNISINLAAHRWSMPQPGQEPKIHRALVARLVLSKEAAMQLAQSLANLSQANRGNKGGKGLQKVTKKPAPKK